MSLGCASTWAPTQRFGDPPAHLNEKAKNYREFLLREVLYENQCPDGFPPMEGHWRILAPQSSTAPRDEIYFRGAKFTEFIAREEKDKKEYGILHGWYACVDGNKIIIFVDSVDPEGAFDNNSGDSYPCQVYWNPMTKRDTFALLCSFDWNPAESSGYSFQRVGY